MIHIFEYRDVAQFGSALGSGPRGRGFESRHLDHLINKRFDEFYQAFFIFISKII